MFLRVNFKVGNIPISEERTGGLRFKNRNLTNPLGRLSRFESWKDVGTRVHLSPDIGTRLTLEIHRNRYGSQKVFSSRGRL